MNFLAHLFLSGKDQDTIIGNFIGDSVNGSDFNNYPVSIKNGILLHRKIDYFTDNHPAVYKSKIRLRPKYRKYAPVIVDVFYDYFLAENWEKYHDEPLNTYTQRIYSILTNQKQIFPKKSVKMLPYMIAGNWLYNYKEIKGIEWALKGMSRRTIFNSNMETAHIELKRDKKQYQKEFNEFFPELINYVKEQGIEL